MRQKYAKAISCLLAALLLTGCQTTPSSVKNKAKDYTNSKDVAVDKEEFVSVDHLLDNMDSLLKASYQNMILADTIHIEQPQSVSILQLEIPKNFANKNKVSKLSKLILGTNKYDHLIKNYKDEKWAIGNSYQISLDPTHDNANVDDSGAYVAVPGKPYIIGSYGITNIYHPDSETKLGKCSLNGKNVSLDKQYQYVNSWCSKNGTVLEPQYNYKVKTMYKCTDNGIDYLSFDVCKYYKGIPFDDIDFDTDDDKITQNGIDRFSIRNILELTTLGQNKIISLRNNNNSFVIRSEKDYSNKLIGLKQALRLVETEMSGVHKNQIVDIDIKYIIYCTSKNTDNSDTKGQIVEIYEARPVWSFIMDNKEHQTKNVQWSRKFINVDMITGDVEYHESTNWDD
ncbi:MAG: hypothetical protein V8S23_09645 [Lachnospiraceae bacterium]